MARSNRAIPLKPRAAASPASQVHFIYIFIVLHVIAQLVHGSLLVIMNLIRKFTKTLPHIQIMIVM